MIIMFIGKQQKINSKLASTMTDCKKEVNKKTYTFFLFFFYIFFDVKQRNLFDNQHRNC